MPKKENAEKPTIRTIEAELAFTVRGPHYSSVRFGYGMSMRVHGDEGDAVKAKAKLDALLLSLCLERYETASKELIELARSNEGRIG